MSERERFARKCVDKRAGGGVVDAVSARFGVVFEFVVGFECEVEAEQYFVEFNVAIDGGDALFLVSVIFVEMRLDADDLVVVADA